MQVGPYLSKVNLKRPEHFINKAPIQNIGRMRFVRIFVNTDPGLYRNLKLLIYSMFSSNSGQRSKGRERERERELLTLD
jgi:hypothetical protein